MHQPVPPDSVHSPSARPAGGAPRLVPLLALALAGVVLGRMLRATPMARDSASRRRAAALLIAMAAFGLVRRHQQRVGEIEGMLRMPPPDESPVTQSVVPVTAADSPIGQAGRNEESRLDEAVQETFPASDPISVHIE